MKKTLIATFIALFGAAFGAATDRMFPFFLPWDDATETFTDLRSVLNQKAIGPKDRVVIANGHPAVNGERVRFWGGCLLGPSIRPTREQSEKMAARFAKFGINLVRFQYIDAMFFDDKADNTRQLDPAKLDDFDYLVSKLKENGIYVILQMGWDRGYKDGDGVPASEWKKAGLDGFTINAMAFYNPKLSELEMELTEKIFKHVNPHTGLSYAEDPAVAFVEIHNESGMLDNDARRWFDKVPEPSASMLKASWNAFLQKKYPAKDALAAAWGADLRTDENPSTGTVPFFSTSAKTGRGIPALKDWDRFLVECEIEYYRIRGAQLKDTLKIKAPISGCCVTFTRPMVQVASGMDYLDQHYYYKHPSGGNSYGSLVWFRNSSILDSDMKDYNDDWPNLLFTGRAFHRPYLVSEFNLVSQSPYGVVAFPLLAAYMGLQDHDGLTGLGLYIWRASTLSKQHIGNIFEIAQDPLRMASYIAAACAFRRGDVRPARKAYYATTSLALETEVGGRPVTAQKLNLPNGLSLISRTGLLPEGEAPPPGSENHSGSAPASPFISDTSELSLDTKAGVFSLNTARSKMLMGFICGTEYDIGGLKIKAASNLASHAALTFTELRGPAVKDPTRHYLLCALGTVVNSKTRYFVKEKDQYTETEFPPPKDAIVSVNKQWGEEPTLVEGIGAEIILPYPAAGVVVRPLDQTGAPRTAKVPVTAAGGNAKFVISDSYKTIWYQVDVPERSK